MMSIFENDEFFQILKRVINDEFFQMMSFFENDEFFQILKRVNDEFFHFQKGHK